MPSVITALNLFFKQVFRYNRVYLTFFSYGIPQQKQCYRYKLTTLIFNCISGYIFLPRVLQLLGSVFIMKSSM